MSAIIEPRALLQPGKTSVWRGVTMNNTRACLHAELSPNHHLLNALMLLFKHSGQQRMESASS